MAAKEVLDLATLQEILLKQVRRTVGCQHVNDIEIIPADPKDGISNWGIDKFVTSDGGGQVPEAAHQVARAFYGRFVCKFPDE